MAGMIDIVIPCRNAPDVLALTFSHLWAYAMDHVRRIFILDNVSTAPRMDALLGMLQTHPKVIVVRHDRNVGVWCSINRGLAMSEADTILCVTSDVLIGPMTIPILLRAKEDTGRAFLCPENGCVGMSQYANLFLVPQLGPLVENDHNGACWLMDWKRLREEVGYYDPRFYICYGDVDYFERLRDAGERDNSLRATIVGGSRVCHLDKQSRRADMTNAQDTDVSLRDGERFREKWKERPDIVARHPIASAEREIAFKEHELGGWEQGKVGG